MPRLRGSAEIPSASGCHWQEPLRYNLQPPGLQDVAGRCPHKGHAEHHTCRAPAALRAAEDDGGDADDAVDDAVTTATGSKRHSKRGGAVIPLSTAGTIFVTSRVVGGPGCQGWCCQLVSIATPTCTTDASRTHHTCMKREQ